MGNLIDLTGQRFGKLIVIKYLYTDKYRRTIWLCQCDCGNLKAIPSVNLRKGITKSCGCYNNEKNLRHGQFGTRLYSTWSKMIERCHNKKYAQYKNYGERGIRVCDEWKNDFVAFYNWAMANGYKDNLTIDRIDNNGNYEPSNCRWATIQQQQNNRRNNRVFIINGEKLTMAEVARKYQINYKSLKTKMRKNIDILTAITELKDYYKKKNKRATLRAK